MENSSSSVKINYKKFSITDEEVDKLIDAMRIADKFFGFNFSMIPRQEFIQLGSFFSGDFSAKDFKDFLYDMGWIYGIGFMFGLEFSDNKSAEDFISKIDPDGRQSKSIALAYGLANVKELDIKKLARILKFDNKDELLQKYIAKVIENYQSFINKTET